MENIKHAFDTIAGEYDAQRKYIIPHMDEFYVAAVWAAESRVKDPAILDIGAGTGLLSALMLTKFPDASLTSWISRRRCLEWPARGSQAGRIHISS
jgi:tRNA (cmo5U34)-methyltransferase